MVRIIWDAPGDKRFQSGIDRGVLYPPRRSGVAWNGLVSVSEQPAGGENRPYYMDGIKYMNVSSGTEFAGSIEAFYYPDEFIELDGMVSAESGLLVDNQARYEFGLSYRTGIGNDLEGLEHGYRVHLVYNIATTPAPRTNTTQNADVDIANFVWPFTTRPIDFPGFKPGSHLVVDSTRTDEALMKEVETILYGDESNRPRLPMPAELFGMFNVAPSVLEIIPDETEGLSPLEYLAARDLKGETQVGLYSSTNKSRLIELGQPGLFRLEI